MPVETLRPSDGRLGTGGPFTSAMPFRILNKGPNYFRRPAEPGVRKLSAVERLEADKAKYVKSQQVALTRQEPVKPPIIRKPLMSPGMMLQCRISTPPARKVPRRPANNADAENGGGGDGGAGHRRGPHLNLEILNNLINVCDGPPLPSPSSSPSPVPSSPSPSASSPSSGCKRPGSGGGGVPPPASLEPQNPASGATPVSSCTSSPLNGHVDRRPPPVPARAPRMSAYSSSPNSVTVRRVDVRPQAEVRKPPRRMPLQPQHKPRQIAQPQVAHSTQVAQPQTPTPLSLPPPPPPPTTTTATSSSSPSPASLPGPQQSPSPSCLQASPLLLRATAGVVLPPASPAFTRISSASSRGSGRKHPSLHRSKSDLSDRYSRATADLERFFNYCGLDPVEVEGMGGVECFARASSDIVSVSKMRSVSTPSSECGGDGGYGGRGRGGREDDYDDDDDNEGPPRPNERVPYSISVIERNARVIKWLYGIRQARDASQNVSNV